MTKISLDTEFLDDGEFKPGVFQGDLDEFWLVWHRAVSVLLADLAATDTLLTGLAADALSGRHQQPNRPGLIGERARRRRVPLRNAEEEDPLNGRDNR